MPALLFSLPLTHTHTHLHTLLSLSVACSVVCLSLSLCPSFSLSVFVSLAVSIRYLIAGQSHSTNENSDHIRIIHKDHESILTFCLKNNSSSMIAFANPREIQEFDISLLLESPNWYEDECDYDMMNLSKDADTNSSAFLIIQSQEQ